MTLLRLSTLALFAISLSRADDPLADDLLAASRKGNLEQVKALLDKGASVNSKSNYGQTPLFFACDRGYFEIAKLLIDRGADVNAKDTFYGATPLTWAASHDHADIVALLLDHGAKSAAEVVGQGAQEGKADLVKVALAHGPIDKDSLSSALEAAMKAKKDAIVDMLKAAGAVLPEPEKTVELDPAVLQKLAGAYSRGPRRHGVRDDLHREGIHAERRVYQPACADLRALRRHAFSQRGI